jgi:ATP-dependent Clp protease protease subunit
VKSFSAGMSAAHRTGQPVVPVVINCTGGDVYSLFAILDVMQFSKLPIATIVEGEAGSSAAILFTCGKKGMRYMGPNATLMIHDVSTVLSEDNKSRKTEEIKSDAKESDRINKKLYRILDKNSGRPFGYHWRQVQKMGRVDWYLDAKSALKNGYADHIRIPIIKTSVQLNVEFDFR